jgi:hypothetical protein
MAIFGRSHAAETAPDDPANSEAEHVEPQRRSGIFGRSHATETESVTSARSEADYVEPQRRSSIFGSRRRSTTPVRDGYTNGTNTSPRRGLLHRNDAEDASIIAARERVMGAEAAEREADRALLQARAAVREAREHVRRLEREAAEE